MSKLQKSRLGRGLSSLLSSPEIPIEVSVGKPIHTALPDLDLEPHRRPTSPIDMSPAPAPVGKPLELPVESIRPNPHQPRKTLDDTKIAELAASMKSSGVIQPVIVRKRGDSYELIAGERRLRAAKLAGLQTVPAIVRDVDNFEQAQMALIENIQREDLNPIDRAASYRALIDQLGLTQAELASRLGEDRSSIANYLRLLDLSEPVRDMVSAGTLSTGHAKLLAGINDPLEQQRLAALVRSQELSVRNLERAIAEPPATPSPGAPDSRPAGPTVSAHIKDLEQSIARQLGMRAQLKPSARKGHGRLVLHYASLDQFDALLAKIGVQTE